MVFANPLVCVGLAGHAGGVRVGEEGWEMREQGWRRVVVVVGDEAHW